jgi:ATP-dependent Clp protease ATP-binding subunit ClpX
MDGVNLRNADDAISEIVEHALKKKTGARASRSTLESLVLEIMCKAPKQGDAAEVLVKKTVFLKKPEPVLVKQEAAPIECSR